VTELLPRLRAALAGRYGIERELGRGGMATVYLARDLKHDRDVALKILRPELAAVLGAERFLQEIRISARLDHPHILTLIDSGAADGFLYYVLPFVRGESLRDKLTREKQLGIAEALAITKQVASALDYAHRQGVVHRDIKPENVLLDASGRVKLSDFGIARLLDAEAHGTVTTAGHVVGTPRYMAPELLAGAEPDPRMDVYSVGVVLREMVGGRPGADALPPGLERIAGKAVAPDPRQRYASAEEMARDLAGFAADSPGDDLPSDERNWLRAVALIQTLATAVALWAFLLSVTPKTIAPGEVQPLIMLRPEHLEDGRIFSRARFETWPTLAALAAISVAVAAYGLLRRHWRRVGLERAQPERPVRESRSVLMLGAVAIVVYSLRKLFESRGVEWGFAYVPILGGLIEIAALFFFWMAILQAWRTARPLTREWALWAGVLLALLPPVTDLAAYVRTGSL
jgi:serine/threonine protein kinase